MIRALIADDNPVVRQGLAALLDGQEGIQVVAQASDGAEAIRLARESGATVALLDVRMPGTDGVTAAATLAGSMPVMMLTYTEDEPVVLQAVQAGAAGYLVHGQFDPDELVRAVRTVADGQSMLSPQVAGLLLRHVREQPRPAPRDHHGLTAREAEVMDLIARGRTNHQIADVLFLSDKTIKNHVNRIYAKLGARFRAEAMALWLGIEDGGPTSLGPSTGRKLGP
ncbi:MAG: response regulator [Egibacteraceae bacterium]|jgi:DNA-binding NarL/FixJ family response regulator